MPEKSKFDELDLSELRHYPLAERENKVTTADFCALKDPEEAVGNFLESLPTVLAADDFREVCREVAEVTEDGGFVGAAIGAHVIKTGCTPILQDLIERGVIDCVVMHGAVPIHDYELALIGETSEDVGPNIAEGRFGMWQETAEGFGRVVQKARKEDLGLGEAYGKHIVEADELDQEVSVLATCWREEIPATIHVAFGTDIVHMNPHFDPSDLGEATMRDFRILCHQMTNLQKGVWLNIGSAVLLPEVFLKAVAVARNLGHDLDDFLAVNFDMIQHYRPAQNVVGRPAPRGISITGHHEMLLPLFRQGILHYRRPGNDGDEQSG